MGGSNLDREREGNWGSHKEKEEQERGIEQERGKPRVGERDRSYKNKNGREGEIGIGKVLERLIKGELRRGEEQESMSGWERKREEERDRI